MKLSKQSRRDAKQLFRNCFANEQLDEGKVRQTVTRLLAAKPRGYLAILAHFQRLLKLEEARRGAKIESAVPLAPEFVAALKNDLERRYGRGLNYSFSQRADLLGGIRV